MSEVHPENKDEIDFIEYFETLWDGKWLISAFAALATLLGSGYSQIVQPKYDVYVPYSFNFYSVSAQQVCGGDIACMENMESKRIKFLVEGGWSSTFYLSTTTPLDKNEYQAQIDRTNLALTNKIYQEATNEISLIKNELTGPLLGTERVATNMLNASRIIQSIDDGQRAITFGSIVVARSTPRLPQILILSAALGGMIGVFYILLRNALKIRKSNLAEEN